ncbi:uncharacterized protein LOC119839286 [Zerene cesonia]|uniref:uncharacterized protein LOC119839286 n=1 Tax=Zerene cesonia TaxID=33412 RepID=UPI0018E56B67|nr:uncharacterized protein LOC119839286 [Zerene cesonia]
MYNAEHLRKMQCKLSSKPISSFFKKSQDSSSHSDSVAKLELKLCGFMAEHNISYKAMDHLSEIVKSGIPDSKIAADIRLKRTKCTSIVKNVIGDGHKKDLEKILRESKFSVLVDESTDISAVKTMCIVVRLFDPQTSKITSLLWELRPLFEKYDFDAANLGATGEAIYDSIVKSFQDRNVPLSNIIGFVSDGASVIMGKHNSVASRFKESNPGIIIFKCICHSLHLCASEACKKLPRRCEDLARNVYGFFKNSSKRQAEFVEFQAFTNTLVHKILHPSQTRWLSLLSVVIRMLEQWEALKLFFTKKWLDERVMATELIFKDLNDPFTKLYFLFLRWVLPKFVYLNEYFQKSGIVITELDKKMRETYQKLLFCYMKRDYITQNDLSTVDPTKQEYFINVNQVYLGVHVMTEMANPNIQTRPDLVAEFQNRPRDFIKTAMLIQKKWKTLRDGYTRYAKKIKPKSGSAALNIRPYAYYQQMSFLKKSFNFDENTYKQYYYSPLSPQCSGGLVPMDQGVIKALKTQYRKLQVLQMIQNIENSQGIKSLSVLDAILMISEAWEKVTQTTIANCFHHAGFKDLSASQAEDDGDIPLARLIQSTDEDDNIPLGELFTQLQRSTATEQRIDIEEFIGIDDSVAVCALATEEEILAEAESNNRNTDEENEDQQDPEEQFQPTTISEALHAVTVLQKFVACNEV